MKNFKIEWDDVLLNVMVALGVCLVAGLFVLIWVPTQVVFQIVGTIGLCMFTVGFILSSLY